MDSYQVMISSCGLSETNTPVVITLRKVQYFSLKREQDWSTYSQIMKVAVPCQVVLRLSLVTAHTSRLSYPQPRFKKCLHTKELWSMLRKEPQWRWPILLSSSTQRLMKAPLHLWMTGLASYWTQPVKYLTTERTEEPFSVSQMAHKSKLTTVQLRRIRQAMTLLCFMRKTIELSTIWLMDLPVSVRMSTLSSKVGLRIQTSHAIL